MPNPVALLFHSEMYGTGEKLHDSVLLWCPGCDELHQVTVPTEGVEGDTWQWNGKLDETLSVEPSILVRFSDRVCHSFLRDGIWDFLGDSGHALAGQKVPMVPLPDWVVARGD